MARRLKPPPAKAAPAPARDAALDAFMDQANGAGRTPAPKAKSPQQKFQDCLRILDKGLIEREEEERLVLTAMLCRQHVLLISPPGAAKTMLADALCRWISGARKCVLHCNKDTTRSAAFGPVKLSALKSDKYERVLDGGIADSHIVVFEELYKAGPAVLDMFLLLLSDRIYKEGVFQTRCPLLSAIAVSNEWSPDGCETALAALSDRFLFRKQMSYVGKAGRQELLRRRIYDRTLGDIAFPEQVTLQEVEQAQKEALGLPWTDEAFETLWEIVEQLEAKGGHPGDRRLSLAPLAAQAAAYLAGAQQVHPEHLEVLGHVLWVAPEKAKETMDVVLAKANSLKVKINDVRLKAVDVVANAEDAFQKAVDKAERDRICTATKEKLQDMYRDVRDMRPDPLRDKVLAEIELHGKEWKRRLLPGAAQD